MPIRSHMKRVFRNAVEMIILCSRDSEINGATGGWTVWALSRDQLIQHVFKARGGSIDVSYPHVGMDCIWLSDSPNWV